jgi:hippurate hydrolase
LKGSEDFGFYTELCPGAYFFFCTKRTKEDPFIHNPRFNFDDELIETASVFWLKLALDRIEST